jgi:hypothetical protein
MLALLKAMQLCGMSTPSTLQAGVGEMFTFQWIVLECCSVQLCNGVIAGMSESLETDVVLILLMFHSKGMSFCVMSWPCRKNAWMGGSMESPLASRTKPLHQCECQCTSCRNFLFDL